MFFFSKTQLSSFAYIRLRYNVDECSHDYYHIIIIKYDSFVVLYLVLIEIMSLINKY